MKFENLEDLAFFAIKFYLQTGKTCEIKEEDVPKKWRGKKASFVTLTLEGRLRGCIGSIYPGKPLYEDVIENAIRAAFFDPRFPPLSSEELEDIKIDVSVLTPLKRLKYKDAEGLLEVLGKKKPGVLILYNGRRAVFIPKVWNEVENPEDFLNHLCLKAGLPLNFWRENTLDVWVFKEEEI